MTGIALDHCAIGVSDWDGANRFWRDIVGAEVVGLPRGLWAYRFGDQQITVHGPGATPQPPGKVTPGSSHVALTWPAPIANLSSRGVEIEHVPCTKCRGCRRLRCGGFPLTRCSLRHGSRARSRRRALSSPSLDVDSALLLRSDNGGAWSATLSVRAESDNERHCGRCSCSSSTASVCWAALRTLPSVDERASSSR